LKSSTTKQQQTPAVTNKKESISSSSSTPKQKQTSSTINTKQDSTSSTNVKQAKVSSTSTTDKPFDKKQLFINSIKESVSVSEMKTLYPKAQSIKMKKRKVGPNHKVVQFAFIAFENEADCSEAMKAHTQIGGEKVNVAYAFLQKPKNEQQQQQPKPSTPDSSSKKQKKEKKNNETTSPVKANDDESGKQKKKT